MNNNKNFDEKYNSVTISKSLIQGDSAEYGRMLMAMKNISTFDSQKFKLKIYQNLKKNTIDVKESIQLFNKISNIANNENSAENKFGCIFEGFMKYWEQRKLLLQQIKYLFQCIYRVNQLIVQKYIFAICQSIEYFSQQARIMLQQFVSKKNKDQFKILPLIYQFNFVQKNNIKLIIELIYKYNSVKDVIYIFKNRQGHILDMLVEAFINNNPQDKRCQTIINQLQLDAKKFPNYIRNLKMKYLRYQIRTFKLYKIQLNIKNDQQMIVLLIEQLLSQKKYKQAKYFIVNYGFINQFKNIHISPYQLDQITQLKNILIDKDHFGPTQEVVLNNKGNFIYLYHFQIKQQKIIFINLSNIQTIQIIKTFPKNSNIGIDSQNIGGKHVFDPPQISLLQIYNGSQIFLFDYLFLKKNILFKRIIGHLFSQCRLIGQDIKKQLTNIQKQLQLGIQQKTMQQLFRNRLIDVGKYFKQLNPKQTKSSLHHQCQVLFNKQLSKYQQCSNWQDRPLRKAQMHYAALDCVLPLKIAAKLSYMQQSQNEKHKKN